MHLLYIMWALLAVLFAAIPLVMKAKEDKAVKRVESAIDPMFRPSRSNRASTRASKSSR
jgi:hypothetical protein